MATHLALGAARKASTLIRQFDYANAGVSGDAMDLKLTGRTALITGSSKGIGLAVAQWFAREGVNVMAVAQGSSELSISFAVHREAGPRVVRAVHQEFLAGEP